MMQETLLPPIQENGNTGSHLSGDFLEYSIDRFILRFSRVVME